MLIHYDILHMIVLSIIFRIGQKCPSFPLIRFFFATCFRCACRWCRQEAAALAHYVVILPVLPPIMPVTVFFRVVCRFIYPSFFGVFFRGAPQQLSEGSPPPRASEWLLTRNQSVEVSEWSLTDHRR